MFFNVANVENTLLRLKCIKCEKKEDQLFLNNFIDTFFSHPISTEFYDVVKIVEFGKKKYTHTNNNILTTDRTSLKENHSSMSRHLAQGFCGIKRDPESGLSPFTHLATRALVASYRSKNDIQ